MSTPTNIPETPMGETKQESYFESKEKFQQQLQDIFQTTLRLTRPDQLDQLCQWMEYNEYLTIEDFYDSSYNDPEKFDTKGPGTEYKWKGKMNHLSANVAQKVRSFVRWMTHEDRPYELHDDFLATLTRESYLKFRHMDTLSFSASSPSHHEPYKLKTSFSGESKHQTPSASQTALNNFKKGTIDRISTKKEPCLTPTLMDEGQARNPNTTYNGYKMECWNFALTWKLICPIQHKITQKEQKERTKKGGISLTIMGQRQTYNSIHKPQRSPNEKIGFNQDDVPYRLCNETGIPEFLELQILGIPMVVMVTSGARSLRDPTQQDSINARTLPIYKCHTHFKF